MRRSSFAGNGDKLKLFGPHYPPFPEAHKMLIVFTTAPDTKEAEKLAEAIVIQKLAACVQVLPKMTSFYSWKGAIEKDTEHLLLIKTDESKYAELEEWLLQNHSYEEPEIVAVQASEVSDGYRKWLTDYLGE